MTSSSVVQVGMTTVENLLRVARSDSGAGTAFAAFHAVGRAPRTISVPEAGSAEGLSSEELTELIRQASVDPEFPHARVFVRSVQMGRALTLAVAPLRDGGGRNMIGVVAEPGRRFEPGQLEVLERLAERLLRHLQVVQQMNGGAGATESKEQLVEDSTGLVGGAAARGPEPWWKDSGSAPRGEDHGDDRIQVPPAAAAAGPGEEAAAPDEEHDERERTAGSVPVGAGAQRSPEAWPDTANTVAPAVRRTSPPVPAPAMPSPAETSPAAWWAEPDQVTGLPSLGQFFSRVGRLLVTDGGGAGALVLVVLEVPDEHTTPIAAKVLQTQVRFTDAVARVDRGVLAAALLVSPAGSSEPVVRRIGAAVCSALGRQPDDVHAAHVVVTLGDRREVDELVREAVSRLPGR